jgi:membrane protease YdiL (CAAX protease family)
MEEPEYVQMSPWKRLAYLIALWVGFMVIAVLVCMVLIMSIYGKSTWGDIITMTNTSSPNFLPAFRLFLGLGNSLIIFLAPALVYTYWVIQEPEEYIGARNYLPGILVLVAAIFMIFFLPVIDITSYFNQKMTLPSSLKGLEQWIRDTEANAAQQFKVLLAMKTPGDLIATLCIVALFPAISEEFFFRGCIQPIFKRWTKNTHAAVWITAAVFSFVHFEFLGFVPRMLLGAALGYFFAWSGSIWPSVVVHFINNGLAVVGVYLYQHKIIGTDPDNGQPMFSQNWIYVLSFIIAILLMLLYRKITVDKQLLLTDGEELD